MDCIHLSGVRCYGYIGYLPEEKTLGQWFEVDATLALDLSVVGQSDRLTDGLDYRAAIARIEDILTSCRADTLERAATLLSEALLGFDRVTQVRLRLTKPAPPIPHYTGQVGVELVRTKSLGNPHQNKSNQPS